MALKQKNIFKISVYLPASNSAIWKYRSYIDDFENIINRLHGNGKIVEHLVEECRVSGDHCDNLSYHLPIFCTICGMPIEFNENTKKCKRRFAWKTIQNEKILKIPENIKIIHGDLDHDYAKFG